MKNAFVVAAISSGSGKTLVSCGLLTLFKNMNKKVTAFKCGPDYIDPMFHREVIGVPSDNLDSFFVDEGKIRDIFAERNMRYDSEIAIIEGVMGLYDGMGYGTKGSTYEIASILNADVIIVVNAKGMSRSILAVIAGILRYDEKNLIKGVILNKCSENVYKALKPEIEALGVAALGFVSNLKGAEIESRHLGLLTPAEDKNIHEKLDMYASEIKNHVDIDRLFDVTKYEEKFTGINQKSETHDAVERDFIENNKVKIAVARDEAFCFYYEENLRILEKYGAELVYFSPLEDTSLPENIGAILLGGGYPEVYAKRLSDNKSMLESIKEKIDKDMPVIAECGGFMYLHEKLQGMDGIYYDMVGAICAKTSKKDKLVRFGYVNVAEKKPDFISENSVIKGHEFHYYDSDNNGEDAIITKASNQNEYSAVHINNGSWWGFPHLYYAANEEYAASFVKYARNYIDSMRGRE